VYLILVFFYGSEELYYRHLDYDTVQCGELFADISEVRAAFFFRVQCHAAQHRNSEDYGLI
jgi:hypothetical protein